MQLPIINTILPVLLASLLAANLAATTTGPENGALYIHGGGAFNAGEFVQLVKKATGKAQPTICVITTPQGERRKKGYKSGEPFRLVTTLKERFQLENKKNESQPHSINPQAAFLIRCWHEADTWRFSVEDITSRQRRRYDSVEELLAALRERMPHPNADTPKK